MTDKPSGSFVLWQNTLCNPLADPIAMTYSAWHDGYASAKAERKPLTMEQLHGIREHQRLLEELGPVWAPMLYYFCQSIERAHGIGEQHE